VELYLELKPLPGLPWADDAERIHGLSRGHLEAHGLEPAVAMERLAGWVDEVAAGRQPVFVGFNATFDWMFVTDYLHRFAGRNPFGHSGLDIKAYFMGRRNLARWADTGYEAVARHLQLSHQHTHHALEDAREQAAIMRLIASQ
jgi:DNA polymerase III epsilon subunit-like protein